MIKDIYEMHRRTKVATVPHLPTLVDLASQCTSIFEIGVKRGTSSSAFLLGLPEGGKLISVDIKLTNQARRLLRTAGHKWELYEQDSMKFDLKEDVDMIFFDGLHTYKQLRAEIFKFGHKARKYLVFHDTITFGIWGADGESGMYLPQPKDRSQFDENSHGIRLAIDQYMSLHPEWRIDSHAPYGHGLLVLRRGK